jgi:hypothetical protein
VLLSGELSSYPTGTASHSVQAVTRHCHTHTATASVTVTVCVTVNLNVIKYDPRVRVCPPCGVTLTVTVTGVLPSVSTALPHCNLSFTLRVTHLNPELARANQSRAFFSIPGETAIRKRLPEERALTVLIGHRPA